MPRTAILVTGLARNFEQTIATFKRTMLDNVDADVFVLFAKDSAYTCAHRAPLCSGGTPEEVLRSVLGARLVSYAETDAAYQAELVAMHARSRENFADFAFAPGGRYALVDVNDRRAAGSVLDQFTMVRAGLRAVLAHEREAGVYYDFVVRMRVDRLRLFGDFAAAVEKLTAIRGRAGEHVFLGKNPNWSTDCFFFGTRNAMVNVCHNFVWEYGKFRSFALNGANFGPECQLAQYTASLEAAGLLTCIRDGPLIASRSDISGEGYQCPPMGRCFVYNVFVGDHPVIGDRAAVSLVEGMRVQEAAARPVLHALHPMLRPYGSIAVVGAGAGEGAWAALSSLGVRRELDGVETTLLVHGVGAPLSDLCAAAANLGISVRPNASPTDTVDALVLAGDLSPEQCAAVWADWAPRTRSAMYCLAEGAVSTLESGADYGFTLAPGAPACAARRRAGDAAPAQS
jgi:hypothetical protein